MLKRLTTIGLILLIAMLTNCEDIATNNKNEEPIIEITSPASGSHQTIGNSVNISASASDGDGSIVSVKFFIDGTLITTDSYFPFSYNWSTTGYSAGSHTIRARATDNDGTSTDAEISVFLDASDSEELVAFYPFNNNFNDASGNGHNGTNYGVEFLADRFGNANSTGYFDGAQDYAVLPSGETMFGANPDEWSVSAWMQVDQINEGVILSDYNSSGTDGAFGFFLKLRDTDSKITFVARKSGSSFEYVTNNAIEINSWYMITAVFSKVTGSIKLYINDNLDSEKTFTTTGDFIDNMPVLIGCQRYNGNYSGEFTGWIDDVRLYNYAINLAEIEALYSEGGWDPGGDAPEVSITAPANNSRHTIGNSVNISASASDADGSIASVKFYVDGSLKTTDTSSPYSYSWNTIGYSAGSHTIRARATDNDGATTDAEITVILDSPANSAPAVSITAPANNSHHTIGNSVNISASASDADGSITSVKFYVDGSLKTTDTSSPYSYSWNTTGYSAGSHTIRARATDDDGATTDAEISVILDSPANQAPTVSITTPANNSHHNIGNSVNISASASDGDGSIASVKFYVDGSLKSTDTSSPYSYSWSTTGYSADSHTILARATDDDGASTDAEVSVILDPPANQAPVVNITAPASGSQHTIGSTVIISASASDADGSVANVIFFVDGTLKSINTSPPYYYNWNTDGYSEGSHTLQARATDNDAATTDTEITVFLETPINQPPICDITSPINGAEFDLDEDIDFSVTASDPDGHIINVKFYINGTLKKTDTSAPYNYSFNSCDLRLGSNSLTAVAVDNGGEETNDLATITINNTGTMTDIDGNQYQIVKIGDQIWMAENLKVTHYSNGDPIPNVTNLWGTLTSGAYCVYNNNNDLMDTYGILYNWFAVNDTRKIAPEGWHMPTDEEWQTLVDYLGGPSVAGGKLKETGTTHWAYPNTGATNSSGFNAIPGGYCHTNGLFYYMGAFSVWWSSTQYNSNYSWYRSISYSGPGIDRDRYYKTLGHSVRLVKNAE
jgi:uncharacterized protein (TIGR02145 family)